MEHFSEAAGHFMVSGFSSVFSALLLVLVAFIVAYFVQQAVDKLALCWRDRLGELFVLPGQLAYLLVLLLFAPSVFERLGVWSVMEPVVGSLRQVFMFVPNLLGAALVLWFGYVVANTARVLLISCPCTNILPKLEKVGIEDPKRLSDWVGSLAFFLVLFPVSIAALDILKLDSLTRPAVAILNKCLMFIPNLFVAFILVGIGISLARFLSELVAKMLRSSNVDEKAGKLTGYGNFSAVVSCTLNCLLVLFFVVESFEVLHLKVLTHIGSSVIAYLPNLLGSVVIITVAFYGAHAVAKIFSDKGLSCCGRAVVGLIYIFAGFMVLSQLGISRRIVDTAFSFMMASVAVAFALAFGLGGRDAAGKLLGRMVEKEGHCDCKKEDLQQRLFFEEDLKE